jgi:hypothetical protein
MKYKQQVFKIYSLLRLLLFNISLHYIPVGFFDQFHGLQTQLVVTVIGRCFKHTSVRLQLVRSYTITCWFEM